MENLTRGNERKKMKTRPSGVHGLEIDKQLVNIKKFLIPFSENRWALADPPIEKVG